MKRLVALAAISIIIAPATARAYPTSDWRHWRDTALGPGRNQLMRNCAAGRYANSKGMSYFGILLSTTDFPEDQRISAEELVALEAGMAHAMAVVCPNVW